MKSKITQFLSLLFLLTAFGLKAQVSPSFRWTGYASTTGNVYKQTKLFLYQMVLYLWLVLSRANP
jgi:hypothetical protein